MRVWNFASHHITLWFSFCVDVGIHLRGTYTIHHIPIWTWGGIGLELIFRQFVQVHHITLYYIILCLSFLPLLSLCLLSFCLLCWDEARLFQLGTSPLLMYHLLLFFLLSLFITLMPEIGQRFLLSRPFLTVIYTSNLCVGEGDFVYGMCSHLVLVVFVYFDWMGTQWRYCIPLSTKVVVSMWLVVNHSWLFSPAFFPSHFFYFSRCCRFGCSFLCTCTIYYLT